MSEREQFNSWGRVIRRSRATAPADALSRFATPGGGLLAHGNGRSYGDSCHNDTGRIVPMAEAARIHCFDPEGGVIEADAGITLQAVLARVIPHGFFLEVTPGTAFATLGGAVANDVHGKNHHRLGSFGHSVVEFDLLRSDGERYTCSRRRNKALFHATIGGMGLTGIITRVTLRLMKVPSANVEQVSWRFADIDGYFDAIDGVDARYEYSVAWIDQLATGAATGRGVLMAGGHVADGGRSVPPRPARLSVPFQPPVNLLNRMTVGAFNQLYYRRAAAEPRRDIVDWRSYFYPLDAIGHWNRLYGPRGLFQHQSVYPAEGARETTLKLIECARRHGHASFLTVLKRFGGRRQPGLLSFSRPGFTLTLDFANAGASTLRMLDRLDEIVLDAGGAVNPYKDQRMSAETFAASFPEWRRLEAMRDSKIMSDFWRRTAMRLSGAEGEVATAAE